MVERRADLLPADLGCQAHDRLCGGRRGMHLAAPSVKTPMDEKKDYVGLPPCCTEQGRITAHGALWAMDVRTGKVVGKETFQPPTESGMLSTDGGLLFTGHTTGKFAAYDADDAQGGVELQPRHADHGAADDLSVNGKQYIAVVAGGAAGLRRRGPLPAERDRRGVRAELMAATASAQRGAATLPSFAVPRVDSMWAKAARAPAIGHCVTSAVPTVKCLRLSVGTADRGHASIEIWKPPCPPL